jgi:hypothetical protein
MPTVETVQAARLRLETEGKNLTFKYRIGDLDKAAHDDMQQRLSVCISRLPNAPSTPRVTSASPKAK